MIKTISNLLSNRNFLIGLVIIIVVVLFGWGYFSNGSGTSDSNKEENQEQTDTSGKDSLGSDQKLPENIVALVPEEGSEVELAAVATQITIKTDKEMTAGSEIKVISDKGVDVVTAGNKLTTDLKILSAPVKIEVAGKYTVSYQLNWLAGGQETDSYIFTVK